jgi:FkbM family methyltransferase
MMHHPVFTEFKGVPILSSSHHVYDFVGSATRVSFKRAWAKHALAAGKKVVPGLPPKNEHYLDWIAVLSAVKRSRGTFRMAELGAGWAPWVVRGALATKQCPAIDAVELLAVEADPSHFAWMQDHFRDNGLDPSVHHLLHGAVSSRQGPLTFPVVDEPDVNYGASISAVPQNNRTITVEAFNISDLLSRFMGPVDLLHVDIQGAEYEALPAAIADLTVHVKSLMVGTHFSVAQHDDLAQKFRSAGWREVMNLGPKQTHSTPWGDIALDDGFLLFENPRFD